MNIPAEFHLSAVALHGWYLREHVRAMVVGHVSQLVPIRVCVCVYVCVCVPAKFHGPFWCTVPLQYVYIWLITQAMANWVTTNI